MSNASSPSEGPLPARVRSRRTISLLLLAASVTVLTANVWLLVRLLEHQAKTGREHLFWVLCQPGFTPTERTAAFRQLVADGNREWRSAQLADVNLEGIAIPQAELAGGNFSRVNFRQAHLQRADLSGAAFDLADFTAADLSDANFADSRLYRTILVQANLRHANLQGASLQEANAERADLAIADLSDSDCLMANFSAARLGGANLSAARLEGARFKGADLSLARLGDANLKDADFTNSNWWRSRGLTRDQLVFLKGKFAPSADAPGPLKADYDKWLSSGGT